MSSRNAYLDPRQRANALVLWRSLKAGLDFYHADRQASPITILNVAQQNIQESIGASEGLVSLEYLEIVHLDSLRPLTETDSAVDSVLVGAIRVKGRDRWVRLIDNVILSE